MGKFINLEVWNLSKDDEFPALHQLSEKISAKIIKTHSSQTEAY